VHFYASWGEENFVHQLMSSLACCFK
jgi:hypothetical protein